MKYYVLEIATGDSKIQGKGVYEYDNRKDALASFHRRLGTAMSSELYSTDMIMVIDSFGGVIISDYYTSTEEE